MRISDWSSDLFSSYLLLALQAFDLVGLLAADIGARAAMDEDFEIIARAAGVLADEALFIGLGDGGEERLRLADELAANVDIGGPRAHGETGDQRALDQLVRIVANDLAVLARPRLRLVGVDDEKARAARLRLLGHEAPFEAGREASAAAPAQAGCLDPLDDFILADVEQRLGFVPEIGRAEEHTSELQSLMRISYAVFCLKK